MWNSVFGCFTAAEASQLFAHARIETYRKGQAIFRKGDPGLGLLAVLAGAVRIGSFGREGDQVVLNIIKEGEVFGEIALLDGKQRTADAVALTNCKVIAIDRRDFVPFVRENPEVALRLLSVLCERIRNTTEQVEDIIFLSAPARLAKKLLQIASLSEKIAGAQSKSEITISQRELGNMIGLSRESINKHLAAWQQAGFLKIEGGTITIVDPKALGERANVY